LAWQYVGGTSGVGSTNGYTVSLSGTLTGGIASSPATGDLVVVFTAFAYQGTTSPNISGNSSGVYTGVGNTIWAVSETLWSITFRPFWKVMGGTPDTFLTVTRATDTTRGGATVVQVWRGVDTVSPFIGDGGNKTGVGTCIFNPKLYDPAVTNALIFAGGAGTMPPTSSPYTGLTGMSNFLTVKGDGSTCDTDAAMATYAYAGSSYDPPPVSGGTTDPKSTNGSATFAFRMGASASAYTLTCNNGSYATAGQSAVLLRSKLLVASGGSYSISGQDAILTKGALSAYTLTALAGSYTYTGRSIDLTKGRVLIASVGSYAVAGQAAILKRDRKLTAINGSYSHNGQSVSLLRSKLLTAQAGSYSYVGQSVTLTYTPGTIGYTLTAQAGGYVTAGQSATLLRSKLLTAQAGSYSYAGRSVDLIKGRVITAQVGSYAYNGQSATLLRNRTLYAQHGSFAYVGQSAILTKTGMVWPLETDVRTGVQYGPTGTEYTGTLTGGGNAILMRRR